MKKFTLKGILALSMVVLAATTKLSAQTATITPSNGAILVGGTQGFTVVTTGFGGDNNDRTFVYTITGPGATIPASPANFNCGSNCNSETHNFQFNTAGVYNVAVTVTQTQGGSAVASTSTTFNVLTVPGAPNLWATSSNGTQVSSFTVTGGIYINGPTNIFDPTIGGTLTSTAALGRNDKPSQALGYFYWLPNTGTNGVVNVYAATSTGATRTLIGTLDVNGASNNSLGFVRLGMGPDGTGWILAGDGTTLYLAKFMSNGVNPVTITVEDANVALVLGSVATFQNGDLCVSGNGTIFALANNGGGVTQLFTGAPAGAGTTLTKRLDLEDANGDPFTGTVNGVAFDVLGSLYVSTAAGIYYINQATVNGPAATVSCLLVRSQTGLQDLASNFFPTQTTLPVTLVSFSGNYRNQNTTLTWDAENMQNFSHFEIERSTDGINFAAVGTKEPATTTGRVTYQHLDNLSAVSGKVFYYRLRMVDLDGKFKYSNVILIRTEGKITGINISPNPVISGDMVTVRFESSARATVDFRLTDMSGRVVAKQQNSVTEGTNSVSIANLNRLQPGMYILQMNDGEAVQTAKLIITK